MKDRLWFDVGIKRYTTAPLDKPKTAQLWFDVGIKRYTTFISALTGQTELWFDVGIKRYTTNKEPAGLQESCGLMQESKDIQHGALSFDVFIVVV